MRMLNTDITEINAVPVAYIFANASYIWAVFNSNCRNISGIYVCLPEVFGRRNVSTSS